MNGDLDTFYPKDGTGRTCKPFPNAQPCDFIGLCECDPATWPAQIEMAFTREFPVLDLPVKVTNL
jgi:hypothetical protein